MIREKYNDVCSGIFLLILGGILLVASFSIPAGAAVNIGSDFMPKVTCVLLTVLGIIIVWNGRGYAKDFDVASYQKAENNYPDLAKSVLALFLYMLLLVPIGFLIMTTVYVFAQAMILAPKERRNPVLFAVIGLLTAVVVYVIFRHIFILMLPTGILNF